MKFKKIKIITFVLIMVVFASFTMVIAQEAEQKDKENNLKDLKPPASSRLPEVSPAHPLEKEEEKPQSAFVLAGPVIANPAEEE